MSSQDNDQDIRVVAVVLISAILLAVGLAVGMGIHKSRAGAGKGVPAAPAVQALAPAADASASPVGATAATNAAADDASIVVENGVVKFYFASGKADLAPGAAEALSDAVAAAKGGKKLVLSGFHDATGNPALNAELAKKRALALRDALVAAGVTESSIEMNKPEQTTGTGDDAQARRVEVVIVD
ncbi:MAG: OmpA family protein [Gammaproteobacteria bacterium]